MYDNGHTIIDVQEYVNNQLKRINRTNKKGKLVQYSKGAVRNLLADKRCAGIYTFKGNETPNAIPKIVDIDVFNRVQERLQKNKQSPSRLKTKNDYILTTKLFCGHCKDMMVGISGTSQTQNIYEYYSCNKSRKKLCNKKNVPKKFIEDLVIKEARNTLTDKNIEKITKILTNLVKKENDNSSILKILKTRLEENDRQKTNLLNSLKMCNIESVSKTIFEEIQKLEEEYNDIKRQIEIENAQKINLDGAQIKYFLELMRSGNIDDITYRKSIVNALINKIYLYDDNITIFFNTQDKEFISKVPTIEEAEVHTKNTPSHQNVKSCIPFR